MPEELEKTLRREARKRKIKDKDAYVYGTMRNLGWKTKKKNKKGRNLSTMELLRVQLSIR